MLSPDRRHVLSLLAAAAAGPALGAPLLPRPPAARPGAGQAADGSALVAAAGLSGSAGFVVLDAATGATLEALNPATPFAPASVAKIPTALHALAALGPDHRFRTRVAALGPIEGGRLRGDLALAGGGDPELDSADLAALAQAAAARARAVEGRFLVAGGPAIPLIDPDQNPEAPYNPAVGALNLNYNRVRLAWERRANGPLRYAIEAHADRFSPAAGTVALRLAPDDCGCPAFDHRAGPEGEVWQVRDGALRGRGSVFLPVRAPGAYAAGVFRDAAARAGLALPPGAPSGPVGGDTLAEHRSRPVAAMAADMLRWSTNLTAEALGQAAAGGGAGDLAASAAATNAWAAAFAGFAPDAEFALVNHSGLSARSRLSPRRMGALLLAARARPGPGPALAALLPERGADDEGAAAPAGMIVRAKTGTLDYARGLAGYVETPSGRTLAFAWFANDLDRRAALRQGRGHKGAARAWGQQARALERALLRSWAARFG